MSRGTPHYCVSCGDRLKRERLYRKVCSNKCRRRGPVAKGDRHQYVRKLPSWDMDPDWGDPANEEKFKY